MLKVETVHVLQEKIMRGFLDHLHRLVILGMMTQSSSANLSQVHKRHDFAFLRIYIIWKSLKNYEVTFQSEQALVLHDSITAFESSLFVAAINFLNRATVSSFYNTLRRAHSFIHSEPFQHVSESLFLTETTCM